MGMNVQQDPSDAAAAYEAAVAARNAADLQRMRETAGLIQQDAVGVDAAIQAPNPFAVGEQNGVTPGGFPPSPHTVVHPGTQFA